MPRSDYYGDDGEVVKEQCPRCEDAFLAEHEDRMHCGRCGYTEWT